MCPPRWACLPICLPSGFVFHLGWGAVSASLGLSPNLSPTWLCLSPWLGCCVRLAGLVSQFVSHRAFSFSLAGVLCPPRWACLRSCLPICLLLALSFTLAGVLCPPRWACLPICLPICLPSGLGCCVRLARLVFLLCAVLSPVLSAILAGMLCLSPVLSPSLSPIWSGVLCPPPWSCLSLVSGLVSQLLSLFCLVACLSSGMLCLPLLGLSFSCLWPCLPACLGCCVRLLGSSPSPACLRSFVPSCFPAGLVCPCSGFVSKISCAICATVWGLRWCNFKK